MDRKLIAGLGLLGVLAAPTLAQEADSPPQPDVKRLIEQLGEPSYKVRKNAEEALRARGDEARSALQEAAEKSDDPEVRWRAQRLLNGGEAGKGLRLRGLDPAPGTDQRLPSLEHHFDDLFGRLERDFGIDVPRHRFFGEGFFHDLDQQMQEMQERMRSGAEGLGSSQSMQMQVGPDGVSVRIKERNDKGDLEEKTYEADDMESFRDKYPDIAKRYLGDGGGLRWKLGLPRGGRFPAIDRLPSGGGRLLPRNTPPTPTAITDDGPKLGVMVQDLSPDVGEFLGLEEGQGLVVQEVLADSLAASLGLRTGDVVVEVNGRKVFGVEDVAGALAEPGDATKVEINRRGEKLTLTGAKPAPQQSEKAGGELKKRAAGDKPQIR